MESLQECMTTRVLTVSSNTPVLCDWVSEKLPVLHDSHWNSFWAAGIFSETRSFALRSPVQSKGSASLLCGTVAQAFLCVVLWVLHHLQTFCSSRSELLQGLKKLYLPSSLDPVLNPPDFYLLAEAPSQLDTVHASVRALCWSLTSTSWVTARLFSTLDCSGLRLYGRLRLTPPAAWARLSQLRLTSPN